MMVRLTIAQPYHVTQPRDLDHTKYRIILKRTGIFHNGDLNRNNETKQEEKDIDVAQQIVRYTVDDPFTKLLIV